MLTGMLSGFPSLHTPVWKLDALARLGARDDPALRSAKRYMIDANLTMGNLVAIVDEQSKAYISPR